jgi:hypothetical protein
LASAPPHYAGNLLTNVSELVVLFTDLTTSTTDQTELFIGTPDPSYPDAKPITCVAYSTNQDITCMATSSRTAIEANMYTSVNKVSRKQYHPLSITAPGNQDEDQVIIEFTRVSV